MIDLFGFIQKVWRDRGNRRAVVSGYEALGRNYPQTLANIALQGGVFSYSMAASHSFQAGVLEGRRQMALDIIRLSRADPEALYALIETAPAVPPQRG